jgi:hypothetical protein
MAGLHTPLPTLHPRPHRRRCTARGQRGSLVLHRGGLSPPTPCRSPGAQVLDFWHPPTGFEPVLPQEPLRILPVVIQVYGDYRESLASVRRRFRAPSSREKIVCRACTKSGSSARQRAVTMDCGSVLEGADPQPTARTRATAGRRALRADAWPSKRPAPVRYSRPVHGRRAPGRLLARRDHPV